MPNKAQDAFVKMMQLVNDGAFGEVIRLIIEEKTLEAQLDLLQWLNWSEIKLIEHIRKRNQRAMTPDPNSARDLPTALARANVLLDVLTLAVDRVRTSDQSLADALGRAQTFARALAHILAQPDDSSHTLARAQGLARALADALTDAHAFANTYEQPLLDDLPLAESESVSTNIAFSAFYPYTVEVETEARLFVYAHLEADLAFIELDVVRFRDELPGKTPPAKRTKEKVQLKPGTMLTIVPDCDTLKFNPPALTKRWEPDWVCYVFDLSVDKKCVEKTAMVSISIQVEGVEIANIKKCVIEILEKQDEESQQKIIMSRPEKRPVMSATASPENELTTALAKFETLIAQQTTTLYHKIFVSYSHKDVEVVRACKAAQEAIGSEVFVDIDSIHTDEDWLARLALEIDRADVLQLFWSNNAAASEFVKQEWEYALLYKRPDEKGVGFIRPVFWKGAKPQPAPLAKLAHLRFRRIAFGKHDL